MKLSCTFVCLVGFFLMRNGGSSAERYFENNRQKVISVPLHRPDHSTGRKECFTPGQMPYHHLIEAVHTLKSATVQRSTCTESQNHSEWKGPPEVHLVQPLLPSFRTPPLDLHHSSQRAKSTYAQAWGQDTVLQNSSFETVCQSSMSTPITTTSTWQQFCIKEKLINRTSVIMIKKNG